MAERRGVDLAVRLVVAWPPDDTEESVLGTNLHQETIRNLCLGLNEVAGALTPPGGERPWHAFGQTTITGWRRRDGTTYTTLPDVYIYRQAIDVRRPSLSLARDGAPLLIIEVLSPTTYRVDLDLEKGKGFSYAQAGVREYLVLDPMGEFVSEGGRGWRLEAGSYQSWRPDAGGRRHSGEINATIGLEGVQVAVYAPDGRRQLREGEVSQELARRDKELAALRRRLEQRRAE